MRFVELHYKENNECVLVNLDTVQTISKNIIHFSDVDYIEVTESLDQLKDYIRCVNELESRYTQYFNTHGKEEV